MHREHYKRIAWTIQFIQNKLVKDACIDTWIEFCKKDNPEFDEEKFREACN